MLKTQEQDCLPGLPTEQERCCADLYKVGITPSHGSSCYLPGKHSGAPTVFSLKRKPVACCFWIQCLLTAVWRRIPPYVLAFHSFLCLQSWYASLNIFTVLCHAQTPQIPFWNGFVSPYTWTSGSLIMSLPLITWGKFKQMQRHKNLALLWAGWLVLHIYIVLFKSGGKKSLSWKWAWQEAPPAGIGGFWKAETHHFKLEITSTPNLPGHKFSHWELQKTAQWL